MTADERRRALDEAIAKRAAMTAADKAREAADQADYWARRLPEARIYQQTAATWARRARKWADRAAAGEAAGERSRAARSLYYSQRAAGRAAVAVVREQARRAAALADHARAVAADVARIKAPAPGGRP